MRDLVKAVAGAAIAVLLFVWVFHGVGREALFDAIRNATLGGLVMSAVLQYGHNVFRVLRWRLLLAPVREGVPFRPMITAVTLGYLVTWTIPGRLGELVRPALLSSREDVPLGPCMGTVVVDRILDGVAILMLFAFGVMITPLQGEAASYAGAIRAGSVTTVGVLLVLLAILVGLSLRAAALEARFEGRRGLIAWTARTIVSLSRGTDALRSPARLAAILFHSLAAWATVGLGMWVGLRACGIDIPFAGVFVMQPMLAIGVAVPTPGGAGGFHAAAKAALIYLFVVPETLAVSASILLHLAGVVPVFLVGAVLLWVERLSVRDLRKLGRGIQDLGTQAPPVRPTPAEEVP